MKKRSLGGDGSGEGRDEVVHSHAHDDDSAPVGSDGGTDTDHYTRRLPSRPAGSGGELHGRRPRRDAVRDARSATGKCRFRDVVGPRLSAAASDAARARAVNDEFGAVAPKFVELTNDVVFDDLWRRSDLSPRDRS